MAKKYLTAKQSQILQLRECREATIDQIARWAGISQRAVYYRLQNARGREERVPATPPQNRKLKIDDHANRRRSYNLSQLPRKPGLRELTVNDF